VTGSGVRDKRAGLVNVVRWGRRSQSPFLAIAAAILLTLLPEGLRFLSGIEHLPGFTAERPLSWIGDTRMMATSVPMTTTR